MGGQTGDSGMLTFPSVKKEELGEVSEVKIFDTKRENNLIIHLSNSLPKYINQIFVAQIDMEKRKSTERNHSATHLLHEALREVLGTHVEQKGSLVSPDMLRFDFSHFQKLSKEEIRQVEHIVNERIRDNFNLEEMREIPVAEAQKMGTMALFGEKYGEKVRVIKFGNSIELCGGTHVKATGAIGMMRIISESSIAAGIRRIEAITGQTIEKMLDCQQDMISDLKDFFNNSPNLIAAAKKLIEENAELKKQLEDTVRERISTMCDKLLSGEIGEKRVGSINICRDVKNVFNVENVTIIKFKANISAEHAKILAFLLKNKKPEKLYVAIGSIFDKKPSLTLLLSDDLVAAGMNASTIIRDAAKHIQGGGGGQPFFAQAGGKNANGLEKALETV
jgi:alanyl-tRNA synthetase